MAINWEETQAALETGYALLRSRMQTGSAPDQSAYVGVSHAEVLHSIGDPPAIRVAREACLTIRAAHERTFRHLADATAPSTMHGRSKEHRVGKGGFRYGK